MAGFFDIAAARKHAASQRKVIGTLDAESIMRRAIEAEDVYAELDLIIRDMRAINRSGGCNASGPIFGNKTGIIFYPFIVWLALAMVGRVRVGRQSYQLVLLGHTLSRGVA